MTTANSITPARPRLSAIPTPGTRSRSSSNVYQSKSAHPQNDDISRALADAIRANDPSHHRPLPLSATASSSSLSPQTLSYSLSSGSRSVAARPSSSASTASRAKTPVSARPSSRPPSRQSDASSRLSKSFDIGENVRIESLGFEGTLRFIGDIDGKPGLWAGVELSGGFAGKGKNNGSVAGKQYFSCPEKCGVFVATTKLSPPTVGPSAIQRPASVASSRGGRSTPALTGRMTPSLSIPRTPSASFLNGRVTPSSTAGRSTPGMGIPTKGSFKTPTTKKTPNGVALTDKITAGSRAAKYMNMTAKQLNSRDLSNGADSPTRKTNGTLPTILPSPTISRTLSSPSRPPGSPFSTPRAGSGRLSGVAGPNASPSLPSSRGRPSTATAPRPRIPSGIAMPPPPSPKISQQQLNDTTSNDVLPARHKRSYSRPSSSASVRSVATDEVALVEQLQSRLDALEYENERLRTASEVEPAVDSAQSEQLQAEKQHAIDRATALDTKLTELEQDLKSRDMELRKLESQNVQLTMQLNDATSEAQRNLASHEQETQAHNASLKSLRDQMQELERFNSQKDAVISANASDIGVLRGDLERAYSDLEEERKELGAQIDELRVAGQETIALYEERLSGAKSDQYELEQRIVTLESRLRAASNGDGVHGQVTQRSTTSAAQIDNETLRDQVQYLQKKSAKLEEQLEDARAALERDVSTYQEKMDRVRIEEEQRKRDLLSKSREVEQLLKSEARATSRVEEIEEALRESTVALENARGEVESLRAELANLDVLIDDDTEGDITSRLTSLVKRAASERTRHQKEINRLEQSLKESRNTGHHDLLKSENRELKEQLISLQSRVSTLMQTVDDQTGEMETLRKRANREISLSNGVFESKAISPKSESSANREEVAGLKHIVQELQKESLAATQRIKLLESENQLLAAEASQLREEVNILEDNMNNSLLETDKLAESPSLSNTNDIDVLRRQMKEQKVRLENELDQMRKKLTEVEMKNARAVHDLNKEISELETLVESKIYREDELEQELERMKDKLARYKKSSKNTTDTPDSRNRLSVSSTTTINLPFKKGGDDVCEICERPGHDIFNCSLLKEEVRIPTKSRNPKELFCQDCERHGHTTSDCPHSLDVF